MFFPVGYGFLPIRMGSDKIMFQNSGSFIHSCICQSLVGGRVKPCPQAIPWYLSQSERRMLAGDVDGGETE